jgi:ABC-type nickel/cobalt efflux system permease component RcnA
MRSSWLEFLPGVGGLPTMRLHMQLEAAWPVTGEALVRYEDTNAPERLGWREVVIRPLADTSILGSTVPGVDRSQELTNYPTDATSGFPQETAAEFRVRGARAQAAPGVEASQATNAPAPQQSALSAPGIQPAPPSAVAPRARGDRLADLITADELTPTLILASLLIAFALGGLHALSPGHGKTIVAAYLVGSRGTAKHALLLGAIVTVAHTAGVFILGIVTLSLSSRIVPEHLYPIIQLLSGVAIAVVGVRMFSSRVRDGWRVHSHAAHGEHAHDQEHGHARDHAAVHSHGHGRGHAHDHAHSEEHAHDHGHSHEVPAGEPTAATLLALGVSGGILPCPSALVVLLSAVALHRVGAGLVLIVAFSLGLASVLSVIGILVVRAGTLLSRFDSASGIVRRVPAFSALFVCILGLGLALGAVPDVQRAFF